MEAKRLRVHACPQCGSELWRVHRLRSDRWLSLLRNIHRYRCRDLACRWEGTIPRSARRRSAPRVAAAKRALAAGVAIGLALLACIRFFEDIDHPPQACVPATVLRYVPAGESHDGFELTEPGPGAAVAESGLALRQGCAWGVPGRSPYRGSVKEALIAAHVPADVVRKIESQIALGVVSDRLEISRGSIRALSSPRIFDTRIVAMGFGRTLCFDTQVNFTPGHVEIADLYEAADDTGQNYAVMVPYVCGNVSVLAERAERPEAAAKASGAPGAPVTGTGRPRRPGTEPGGVWIGPPSAKVGPRAPGAPEPYSAPGGVPCEPGGVDPRKGVQTVPEPGTAAMLLAAGFACVIALGIGRRRRRDGAMQR